MIQRFKNARDKNKGKDRFFDPFVEVKIKELYLNQLEIWNMKIYSAVIICSNMIISIIQNIKIFKKFLY